MDMADGDHVSHVEPGHLWDAAGREWTTKHTRWVTAKQASAFARRTAGGGLLESPGQPVLWMTAEEMAFWWAKARDHFEIPGSDFSLPDEHNRTWAAHLWRRGAERLIVFEANC
jgi:hypothetical protein